MEDFTCECGVFFYWESVFVGEGKIGKRGYVGMV
jgi:hypothetical protein